VFVGICWQISLVALPIYIVTRNFRPGVACFAVVALTSVILKFTWYDRLEREDEIGSGDQQRSAAIAAKP
jgi:hypothetical protein